MHSGRLGSTGALRAVKDRLDGGIVLFGCGLKSREENVGYVWAWQLEEGCVVPLERGCCGLMKGEGKEAR